MPEEITKILKVSPETIEAIKRKSAQTLPDRPSEQGISAGKIKERLFLPVIDATNSAIAEIDRVVVDINAALAEVDGIAGAIDTAKVDKIDGMGLSENDYTTPEKNKLVGIEAGAQANTVTGVKGGAEATYRIGTVNITKTNIGLGSVDDTADINKPVSDAQKSYIDGQDFNTLNLAVSESETYTDDMVLLARGHTDTKVGEEAARAITAEVALSVRIDAQEGLGGYLDAYDFENETPSQDDLTAYALLQIPSIVSDPEELEDRYKIWNGTRVTNLYDNTVWQLTNTQNTVPAIFEWTNIGSAMVSRATQDTLGIVRGGSSVSVESDGSLKATAASVGAVAEVLVGETITLDPEEPAEVENVGTGSTPILKFKIPKGEKGEKGEKGDEPVKGVDYWTENDKMELIQAVVDVMDGGLIGYVDSNNNIILIGGLAGEIYTVKYKMDDNSLIDIGELVLADKYSVTNNLANCTTDNVSVEVIYGDSYSAIITANVDHTMSSVTVLMGGVNITSTSVSGNTISIASVTGDIVITASAVVIATVNQITISTDASGNPFNGGQGWKTGFRLSLSSGGETAASDYEVTGFIPISYGDIIRVKNIDINDENSTNIIFYDSAKAPIGGGSNHGGKLYVVFVGSGTESNGVYTSPPLNSSFLTIINNSVAYIRIGSTSITNESVLTVNQEIV